MNIQLKKVKIFHSLSTHSYCFQASLFINNTKAAFVSSNGSGSSFFYSVFSEDNENYLANKKLLNDAVIYANSQEPRYDRELGSYNQSNLDMIVLDCLAEYMSNQELVTA